MGNIYLIHDVIITVLKDITLIMNFEFVATAIWIAQLVMDNFIIIALSAQT